MSKERDDVGLGFAGLVLGTLIGGLVLSYYQRKKAVLPSLEHFRREGSDRR